MKKKHLILLIVMLAVAGTQLLFARAGGGGGFGGGFSGGFHSTPTYGYHSGNGHVIPWGVWDYILFYGFFISMIVTFFLMHKGVYHESCIQTHSRPIDHRKKDCCRGRDR